MGNKEWEPTTLLDVFGDELARQILVSTYEQPLTADALADRFEVSLPTIYRRVNALNEYNLLKEHHQIDSDGHHYKTFETTVNDITFELGNDGYSIDAQLRQSLTDQFESFWSDLEGSTASNTSNRTDHSPHDHPTDGSHHG